jgi:hypothetical protein
MNTLGAIGLLIGGGVAGVLLERLVGRPLDQLGFRVQHLWSGRANAPKALNGIWDASYIYESSESAGKLEDQYLIVLKQGRSGVTGRSLERPEGSKLRLDLRLERSMVTGTWRELTPKSQRAYHGTCQLLLSSTGDTLKGKWMGFRRDDTIGDGPWTWRRLDTRRGWRARRRYKNRPGLAWHRPVENGLEIAPKSSDRQQKPLR